MHNQSIYQRLHFTLIYLIASVWLINGLFCKALDLVPRHREIVARILGENHAEELTNAIGISEILMAIWIVSRFRSRINAMLQMTIIATMNLLEFCLAPDLLLWGKLNIIFAICFIGLIYYNEFILSRANG